jgi:hypothetical protein
VVDPAEDDFASVCRGGAKPNGEERGVEEVKREEVLEGWDDVVDGDGRVGET